MDIGIQATLLRHHDPGAWLDFYRGTPGFEIRADARSAQVRWITVGPAAQAGASMSGPPVHLQA